MLPEGGATGSELDDIGLAGRARRGQAAAAEVPVNCGTNRSTIQATARVRRRASAAASSMLVVGAAMTADCAEVMRASEASVEERRNRHPGVMT